MEQSSSFNRYFVQLSSVATESFYVLDVLQILISYVKYNDLFLGKHNIRMKIVLEILPKE